MVRKSNIELLRLVAMMMVLLHHANYMSFGTPSIEQINNGMFPEYFRVVLEHLCIIAVNVYVLISGWFGLKPKVKSITSLLTQIVSYTTIIALLYCIFHSQFELRYLSDIIVIGKGYWFIVSYLLLYLVSPILNAFVENTPKRYFKLILICFFIFEFIYGWLYGIEHFFNGYSAISFAGLYLLARYIRLYGCFLQRWKKSYLLIGYVIISMVTALRVVLAYINQGDVWGGNRSDLYIHYNCPFVVLSSIMFFLYFTKIEIKSKVINYMASSALAVYLIHVNPLIWDDFLKMVREFYAYSPNIVGICYVFLFVLAVFIGSILVDKIRLMITPTKRIADAAMKLKLKVVEMI